MAAPPLTDSTMYLFSGDEMCLKVMPASTVTSTKRISASSPPIVRAATPTSKIPIHDFSATLFDSKISLCHLLTIGLLLKHSVAQLQELPGRRILWMSFQLSFKWSYSFFIHCRLEVRQT